MRFFRSTFVGLMIAGGAAVASAQGASPAARDTSAHAQRNGASANAHRGRRQTLRRVLAGAQRGLFKDIPLTDAEKARVRAVRDEYQPRFDTLRTALAPQIEALRGAYRRNDTASMKAIWDQNAAKRNEVKALLEHARDDYRNALDPEHRAQFDNNVQHVERRIAKRAMNITNRGMNSGAGGRNHGARG